MMAMMQMMMQNQAGGGAAPPGQPAPMGMPMGMMGNPRMGMPMGAGQVGQQRQSRCKKLCRLARL